MSHAPFKFNARHGDVIDGDTIDITFDLGFDISMDERIRLASVDTAEIHFVSHDSEEYHKGVKHHEFVIKWLSDAADTGYDWPLIVESVEYQRGSYGRVLANVYRKLDGEQLADALINEFGDEVQ